ncbi:unnamed protein product [Amoebophrya sp. A120]|nr:unnamed protein product [Amoebophrya sp. A120]|eukprot:GSA120T00013186001.1
MIYDFQEPSASASLLELLFVVRFCKAKLKYSGVSC